jgi:hypothetical protein
MANPEPISIEDWAADQVNALRLSRVELEQINSFREALYDHVKRGSAAFNGSIGDSGVQPIRLSAGPGNTWMALERGRKAVVFAVQDQVVWTQTSTRKWSDLSNGWDHAEHVETVGTLSLERDQKKESDEQGPLKFENKSSDADGFARILLSKVIDQK